jgi:hypothetical protein
LLKFSLWRVEALVVVGDRAAAAERAELYIPQALPLRRDQILRLQSAQAEHRQLVHPAMQEETLYLVRLLQQAAAVEVHLAELLLAGMADQAAAVARTMDRAEVELLDKDLMAETAQAQPKAAAAVGQRNPDLTESH